MQNKGGKDLKERRAIILKEIEERKKAAKRSGKSGQAIDDEEWEDVDEYEKEVYATTGYFDIPESDAHISAGDLKILE
jgi:hypothetical protein